MLFKQAINEISGLKYVSDMLNIRSSAGRKYLLSIPFHTNKKVLETEIDEHQTLYIKWNDEKYRQDFSLLEMKLAQLRDIQNTIHHLSGNNVLDDIELFELKYLAILSDDIREIVDKLGLTCIRLDDFSAVIDMLDPEKKRIPYFYIYHQYSEELTGIRKKIDAATDAEKNELLFEAEKLEDEIRRNLSEKLLPYADMLQRSLTALAKLDVLIAKVELAKTMSFTKPIFVDEKMVLKAIFHPQVADSLQKQGRMFQRIDVEIPSEPTVITGANMAGKSVLLKTVAIIQTLAQFGFYVPAATAEIVPVEKLFVSMGDGQNEMNGLSSFASEMVRLNEMVQAVKNGTKTLALIDELARTTNPTEGKAIVCGMVDFLMENQVRSLVTTHYSIDLNCRKWKVKGFIEPRNGEIIRIENINSYMDYSLEESNDNDAPREAIRVAEMMGVEDELIKKIKRFL